MRTLFFALIWTLFMAAGACSLVVDTSITQCRSDRDCTRFGAVCNLEQRVCQNASTSPEQRLDSGTPDVVTDTAAEPICQGPNGCYACPPTTETEIVSQCTDSLCVPFDNSRVTLLGADGRLRPLP